jgi:hypothetical protein
MKFMLMHRVTAATEAGVPRSPELFGKLGQLIRDAQSHGHFLEAAGLQPSSMRVRLTFSGGKRTITKGPLQGRNEIPAGFALLAVTSMDEAIEWATRFAATLGDVELELGPVGEPWDLGFGAKPAGAPLRVLVLRKEGGALFDPAKMRALHQEMTAAGVLVRAEALTPSSLGKRLQVRAGKRTWADGPFPSTKELIAGFALMELETREELEGWTERFADIMGDVDVDVRPLDTQVPA